MLSPHRFNLLLHTKSNGHGREWPIEHYESLARLLYNDPQVHLWLTGSAKEGEWIQEYFPDLLSLPNVTSLFGKQSLSEFTSLINQADGLIASGTGPLHLAAAVGQRCIGLFPPIKPMDITRWEALGIQAQSLSIDHPLHEGCRKTTEPTCECMHAISPETVFNTVQEWVNEKNKTYSTIMPKTA